MPKTQRVVLIIDDSPEDCILFQRYLMQDPEYSYIFRQVDSGAEGLAAFMEQPPDCLLLDYNLPDMDGLEFMQELSKQNCGDTLPCVMLTGQGTETIAVQAMKSGAQDYLVKGNTTPEYLQRAVHNAIEKASLFRQLKQQQLELEQKNRELELFAEEKRQQVLIARNAQHLAENEKLSAVLLSDASSILSSSLNYESTLTRFAQLSTQSFADLCSIDLVTEYGQIQRIEVAYSNPNQKEAAEILKRDFAPNLNNKAGIATVVRNNKSELIPYLDDEMVELITNDAAHQRLVRQVNCQSLMIVPITVRGQVMGTISFVSCNPERQYTAQDLKLAEELARRASLAVDNARLYRETQKAIQARNELLSMLSHDLKNPLGAIKGFVDLMRRRLKRSNLEEQEWLEEGLDKVNGSVKRMTGLLDELLDLAHLQIGQPLDLDLRPVDLVKLASQRVTEHPQLMSKHRVELESSEEELIGNWDSTRLERVLDNLLSNATKYSPKGGSIVVKLQRETQADKHWAVLKVEDKGMGIPEADLPFIFERFHRAGNVGQIGGTGIGLASVRQIIEQHDGTITAESKEGQGTTFIVRLPLSGQENEGTEPEQQAPESPVVGV